MFFSLKWARLTECVWPTHPFRPKLTVFVELVIKTALKKFYGTKVASIEIKIVRHRVLCDQKWFLLVLVPGMKRLVGKRGLEFSNL